MDPGGIQKRDVQILFFSKHDRKFCAAQNNRVDAIPDLHFLQYPKKELFGFFSENPNLKLSEEFLVNRFDLLLVR